MTSKQAQEGGVSPDGLWSPDESLPLHKLRARALERAWQQVDFARANSPNYASRLSGVGDVGGSLERFAEVVPLMTREDIITWQQEHPPFGGMACGQPRDLWRVFVAPGPVRTPLTHEDFDFISASYAKAFHAFGVHPGDLVDLTVAQAWVIAGEAMRGACEHLGAGILPGGPGGTSMHADALLELPVTFIVGFPTFLLRIGEELESRGVDPRRDLSLRSAAIVGELSSPQERDRLERLLAVDIFEFYGTADTGIAAYACSFGRGMHLRDDVLWELIDPATDEPANDDQPGELVLTDLARRYLPIIRFRTGDVISPRNSDPCPCGRTGTRFDRVLGRSSEIVKVRGMFVVPKQVAAVLDAQEGLGRFQLVVEREGTLDELTLRIEVPPEVVLDVKRLEKRIREAIRVRAKVEMVAPGGIPEQAPRLVDHRSSVQAVVDR